MACRPKRHQGKSDAEMDLTMLMPTKMYLQSSPLYACMHKVVGKKCLESDFEEEEKKKVLTLKSLRNCICFCIVNYCLRQLSSLYLTKPYNNKF